MDVVMPRVGWSAEGLTEVKKSRFIALAARCDDEAQARELFAQARTRWPDARHHCTALVVSTDGGPLTRSSDDGEPAGTAGIPMLTVLLGSGVVNLAVVVTRYFGGIKLGTGGLSRAYTEAVGGVIAGLPRVRRLIQPVWRLQVGHAAAGRITQELLKRGATVHHQTYLADQVDLDIIFPPDAAADSMIALVSQGNLRGTQIGEECLEIPL